MGKMKQIHVEVLFYFVFMRILYAQELYFQARVRASSRTSQNTLRQRDGK